MSLKESLYVKTQDNLAVIEFAYPHSNALSQRLLSRLSEAFDQLSKNREIGIILLKSEGEKAFCAGAELNELISISDESQATAFFESFAKVLLSMYNCKKIIVCRVQGKVVGGGVGIVSSCDYVVANERASIKLSEISIGIAPMVIEPVVKRKIGISAFYDLSLNPTEWKNAYSAKNYGLYNRVFETSKDMDESLGFFLKKIRAYNKEALEAIKLAVNEDFYLSEELLTKRSKISGALALSTACRKALEKFKKS